MLLYSGSRRRHKRNNKKNGTSRCTGKKAKLTICGREDTHHRIIHADGKIDEESMPDPSHREGACK